MQGILTQGSLSTAEHKVYVICLEALLLFFADIAVSPKFSCVHVAFLQFHHNLICPFTILHCSPLTCSVQHSGSISLEDVYSIARIMRPRSIAKEFSGTVKEILGTAQSVGCKVEGKHPHDWIDAIIDGTLEVPVSVDED